METLNIKVDKELKKFLDDKKLIPRETYNSVIKRLVKFRGERIRWN